MVVVVMVMVVGADNDDNGNGGSNSSSDTDQEIYIERRDKKTQIRCKIHSTKVKHIIYMLRRLQYVVHVIAMSNAMCMNDRTYFKISILEKGETETKPDQRVWRPSVNEAITREHDAVVGHIEFHQHRREEKMDRDRRRKGDENYSSTYNRGTGD